MTIGKQLIEHLRDLDPAAAQPLSVATQALSAELAFFDRDRYSVTLRDLTVRAPAATASDARAYLSAAAAIVARQLSFLEEPLAVWELDGGEGMAQLRSSPPQHEPSANPDQGGDELSYWEVTLWAAQPHAHVARYRWAPGMVEREVLPYPATFALLGRMADALAAALSEPAG